MTGLTNVTITETTTYPIRVNRTWGGDTNEQGRWFTTENYDYRIEASEMNALPDQNLAIFSTDVKIPPNSVIRWGVSRPDSNKPGGGIEIYSEDYKSFIYGDLRELK